MRSTADRRQRQDEGRLAMSQGKAFLQHSSLLRWRCSRQEKAMARLAVLAALLLVLGAAGCAAAATILEVEHSLDGGKTYLPAGAITLSTSVSGSPCSAHESTAMHHRV